MKLTPRLEAVADLVSDNIKVADIGTDHGYIPVYLIKKNKIQNAIAADINKGPLDNARKEIYSNNLEDRIELRLGSGLSVLKLGEVDEVVIAGMGGVLISQLIENELEIAKKLDKIILQPMQASSELRKYLHKNSFIIEEEILVKEDFRIYEIMVVTYDETGKRQEFIEDEIYYEVGKGLLKNKPSLTLEFIDKKIKEYCKIIEKLEGKEGGKIESKIYECKNKIKKLEELKNDVC
ncbi:MAG: class I SAM-dependent methyltransferase [Tepidibacter sp.]|jgi:tRNA (adenine22-N1)-methyltransferase|uniref:tRNA (adenine(22)-N(1))-methyltransferase n=1 Tax=Tepidibacter sp. TaxID=2529387 RepID=UPI0025F78744|nr:class I SAM-dependent methyltransferase [Tepidibacter sp.]MCT4509239.1 class I SAM-dependent methyltransferase [Tepidibacter sp.]